MAKKAEPKFKINPSLLGMMVNGEYCTFDEKRLDKVTFPKSFDGILTIPAEVKEQYPINAKITFKKYAILL